MTRRRAHALGRALVLSCALPLGLVGCDKGETPELDAGPGPDAEAPPPLELGDPDTMWARLRVPQPDGFADEIWLTAFAPSGADAPLPVVVLAHGQGTADVANCRPGPGDGTGYPANPGYGEAAQRLADEGFLVVLTAYRNVGDGAPLTRARARDHAILDARGLLAAAHWGRSRTLGGDAVALVGHSMGTYPVMWAVSRDDALSALQTGLDVRTVVQSGESGNHVANWGRVGLGLDAPRDGSLYATALLGAMLATTSVLATSLGVEEWTESHFTDPSSPFGTLLSEHLTENGRYVFGILSVTTGLDGIASCAELDGRVPLCETSCWGDTWRALLTEGTTSLGPPSLWISADAEAAMRRWADDPTDPEGTDNAVLAAMRAGSPAYAAEGPAITGRALHVMASGDSHWDEAAHAVLRSKWQSLGVETVEQVAIEDDGCDHGAYLDPARACGYAEIVAELRAALLD